jgi:hypothetical protein
MIGYFGLSWSYVYYLEDQYKWDNSIMRPTYLLPLLRSNGIRGERQDRR